VLRATPDADTGGDAAMAGRARLARCKQTQPALIEMAGNDIEHNQKIRWLSSSAPGCGFFICVIERVSIRLFPDKPLVARY
jgi:hypothetical protein